MVGLYHCRGQSQSRHSKHFTSVYTSVAPWLITLISDDRVKNLVAPAFTRISAIAGLDAPIFVFTRDGAGALKAAGAWYDNGFKNILIVGDSLRRSHVCVDKRSLRQFADWRRLPW